MHASRLQRPRGTVWVVDDSPLDAEMACRSLEARYRVELFSDGSSALEALTHRTPPDVLVIDWIMPGISGIEMCRFVRSSAQFRNVGVLLLTARNRTHDVVEGISAGASDFISKPYVEEELAVRVTSLVRAREVLERAERAEAAVRTILANVPDALLALDDQGRIHYANEAASQLLHRPASTLVGVAVAEVVPGLESPVLQGVREGEANRLPDVSIGDRIISPTVRTLPTAEGINRMISLREVTEQRRATARRLDFYSMIAHDLRSPLSAILLRAEMLLRGGRGVLPTSVLGDISRIRAGVQSLVALVTDFLELARLENTSYQVRRKRVEVGELLSATLEDLRPLLEAKGQRVEIRDDFPGAAIEGDRARLTQVLSNLLGNAIKFTPQAGEVCVTVRRAGDGIRVIVEDSGPGIAPEMLPVLFDRYTRAPASASHVQGTGLGLLIVREIVEAHGGSVGVESTPGEGSCFWFQIPMATTIAEVAAPLH